VARRVGPYGVVGPRRFVELPVDVRAAELLADKLWVVPRGLGSLLPGVREVVELGWWESVDVEGPGAWRRGPTLTHENDRGTAPGAGVRLVACPSVHWSGRDLVCKNTTLWASYAMVSRAGSVFHTGDTAYHASLFRQIGTVLGPFSASLVGIGAYNPRSLLRGVHADPSDALRIHRDLRSRASIGMHWGTFPMADEGPDTPALELAVARREHGVSVEEFFVMRHGEVWELDAPPPACSDYALRHPERLAAYETVGA